MNGKQASRPLRVCYFGTYRDGYGRNEIMRSGLRAQGVTVYECHATLWRGIEDRVEQASGGWRRPAFWGRVVNAYRQLWRQHRQIPEYDVMVLGYPGVFDAFLGRFLSRRRGVPLVIDHYMSLYLIAEERGLVARSPFSGRLIRLLERTGLRLVDRIITDTPAYLDYHTQLHGLSRERFALVPAGADDRLFYPRPEIKPPSQGFQVVYLGTFIPNHDVPLMVRAAALLREQPDICFHFYGEGPDLPLCEQIAREAELQNVQFHGWVKREEAPCVLAVAHLCLGAFGQTPQSLMTVQNKIWEAAAMARPLVSGDSPTIREAFRPGESIYLVPRNDPQALADAIVELAADRELCGRLGEGAYRRFQEGHSIAALGARTKEVLLDVLA